MTIHAHAPSKTHGANSIFFTPPLWLVALTLGALALVPRVLGLADFMTIDEPYHWIGRVRRFSDALASGDWAATNQTGHPGVTTMWLGALGRNLGALMGLYDGGRAGNSAAFLAMLRLPLACTNALAVVAGYLLLRRIVAPSTALLAALLWATSPFLIAHSRLLHLDALLTSFMTLSVLALLAAVQSTEPEAVSSASTTPRISTAPLVVAGICTGLALLTKAPSLLLLPTGGLIIVLQWYTRKLPRQQLAKSALIWLGVAMLVVCIGWPAMWIAPREAIGSVIGEIISNGGQEHHSGNYFLGREVGDPGWLFYPAVVLWRTTPITLIGLLLLPLALSRPGGQRRMLLYLCLFALLFGGALSIEPKKFDRYLLPIWPSLEILAAAGMVSLWQRLPTGVQIRRWLTPLAVALGMIFLLATNSWYHPYYLAYFNPLLGGGATAQRVMFVGWGEGMEQVGAWLAARPDLKRGPVLSWIGPTLSPFVPMQVLDLQEKYVEQPASYAVLYARSVQRRENPVAEAYVRQTQPLYTLRMFGIDYASVYQLPRPFTEPVDATFGEGLHLRGFSQAVVQNTLVITPSWDVQRSQPGGRFSFVHVLAADGTRVAQVDAPVDEGMFAEWQAGQQLGSPLQLPLPPDLPRGSYRVVLGLYDPATGARLPLVGGTMLPAEIDGQHALLLTTLNL